MSPVRLPDSARLPLLQATVADLAPRALVVGDPKRAAAAAAMLSDVRELGANREYLTYAGTWRGTPITIASHGVGSAGAAVCFEELCRGGVRVLLRAGTAGGMQPEIHDGAIVVATGAVREDGVTGMLVPPAFPALADAQLVMALREATGQTGLPAHSGVVLTSDCFYPSDVLPSTLELWQRAGCVAVEMELSALLVIAAQHGAAAAGIFAIDGNPLASGNVDMSGYQPHRAAVDQAISKAVEAALNVLAGVAPE